MDQWLKELREHTEETIPLVLVGNKLDLSDVNRQVSTEIARGYATESNMLFFETSAYDSTNVTDAFETMFDHVYKELSKHKLLQKTDVSDLAVGTKTVTLRPPSATYEYNHRIKKSQENKGCC